MLFNSYIYLFAFLPFTLLFYYLLNRFRLIHAGKAWLVFSSLAFYSYWNIIYLPLILISMLFNYAIGRGLGRDDSLLKNRKNSSKKILIIAILANLIALAYFKYFNFFISNLNEFLDADFNVIHIVLPLAISFFTFQQIAYLVDSYKGLTLEYDFLNYCLFVSFFPQLIAGPIVHHKEMMPQFSRIRNALINWDNIALGLSVFSIGLFKKVVIADTFAIWAKSGFDQSTILTFVEAWVASLSYTFQLYYDFSGYTDMAIGSALLFNIKLPYNFNSPYKALNIQDFWRRWHMTLSRWLRDYLYVTIGGNRLGNFRTYINLFITFLLGGLWHGAGWTFVLWGAMHGASAGAHKFWQSFGIRMPKLAGWLLTFFFVHCSWVFFRATSYSDAIKVFKGMFGLNGFWRLQESPSLAIFISDFNAPWDAALAKIDGSFFSLIFILFFGAITVFGKNSNNYSMENKPIIVNVLFVSILLSTSILFINRISEFIYFQF